MTSLERLIANGNSIIGFLKTFSQAEAANVTFNWINEDNTEEVITFANIKKFQESVNLKLDDNNQLIDGNGDVVSIDASTISGKTAQEISANTALKFKMILNMDCGGFPERWCWAVTDNNELIHWGSGSNGVSGDTGRAADSYGYSLVPQPNEKKGILIKDIFANTWGGYVLYDDGDLYGIGYSGYGQMGQGNTVLQSNLVKILSDVQSVATSSHGYHQDYNTLLAIKTNNSVWAWGRNGYGQCGNGNTADQYSPIEISIAGLQTNEKVIQAYVTDTNVTSTYLLTDIGRVFACGSNNDGCLGLGDTVNRNVFSLVSGSLSGLKVIELSCAGGTRSADTAYYKHSVVALTDTGEMYSWGYNGNSDLGLGSTTNYNIPQKIIMPSHNGKIIKLFSTRGSWTSRMALTDTGELWGWGYNQYDCLGVTGLGKPTPFKITLKHEDGTENTDPVKDVLMITSGTYSYHHTSLVLTESNKVFTAGYSGEGQLGRNVAVSGNEFIQMRFPSSSPIKQLAYGGHSSASNIWALLEDGRILGWGDNDNQQAATSQTSANVRIPQLTFQ